MDSSPLTPQPPLPQGERGSKKGKDRWGTPPSAPEQGDPCTPYPLELPSDCGLARDWLCEPSPLCLILGSFGLRSSPCRGESILLTCSCPFLTMKAPPPRRM